MPLLDSTARIVADDWIRLDDAAPLPSSGAILLPLARLLAEPGLRAAPLRLGVELPVGAELAPLAPWIERLSLVVVPFPGFRDGRGFTVARTLREQHHFAGEIRASGQVLPDQFVALLRVGVSTVELPSASSTIDWEQALRLGLDRMTPEALPWIRRHALPFEAA